MMYENNGKWRQNPFQVCNSGFEAAGEKSKIADDELVLLIFVEDRRSLDTN